MCSCCEDCGVCLHVNILLCVVYVMLHYSTVHYITCCLHCNYYILYYTMICIWVVELL